MTIAKAIARAWTDTNFKAKLLSDPHTALRDAGVDVPANVSVKVVENAAGTQHIVLPVAPANADQLSAEELEKIAAGGAITSGAYATLPQAPILRPPPDDDAWTPGDLD